MVLNRDNCEASSDEKINFIIPGARGAVNPVSRAGTTLDLCATDSELYPRLFLNPPRDVSPQRRGGTELQGMVGIRFAFALFAFSAVNSSTAEFKTARRDPDRFRNPNARTA